MANYHDRPLSETKQAVYMRAWNARKRATDPEFKRKQNAERQAFMQKKLTDPAFRAKHSARNNKRLKERRSDAVTWARWALNQIRARAKLRGIPFSLEPGDFEAPLRCPALGVILVYGGTRGEMFAPTVDRLRPELGYVKGNVRVISRRANSIKNDSVNPDELRLVALYMEREGL